MKVIIDTNVVMDVLLNRPAFFGDSRKVFELAERGRIAGCISASAITDVFYIAGRQIKDTETLYQAVEMLASLFAFVPVTRAMIGQALTLRWKDFEDAVQFVVAKENDAAYIITRDPTGYETLDTPCISPTDFISRF